MNGELVRMLVKRLESRGLDSRVVTYPGDTDDDEHVEEIVIVNPAARERGEVRVGDDGSVTWEHFGRLDEVGVSNILDEVTNALRAPGVLFVREPQSLAQSGEPRELGGTPQQQLVFLNTHWGGKYSFAAPEEPGGQWTATARFGQHDRIQQRSAAELLDEVRRHYHANKPGDGQR
jgi:hypothetical protein